jgi:DNA-binding NarL/FixJ family response regulator
MENALLETPRTNVFIVEDSAPIRERLIGLLRDIEGVTVVGEAETAKAAVEGILRTKPDSVVLDIQLNGSSGIEVLRKIHPLAPEVVFIVLTNHSNPQYRRLYTEAGASHFLDKTSEIAKVMEVIAGLVGAERSRLRN